MDLTTAELHTQLREWARGMNNTTAATELLIRTGYASPARRWIRIEESGRAWIDFDFIPDQIGALSGGQQRILRIAASIGGQTRINLGDEIAGLDHNQAELALAAITHASGFGVPTSFPEVTPAGDGVTVVRVTKPALFSWPE